MTLKGRFPLPTEEVNCELVTVTEEDVENVVKHIPKIETLVNILSFLKVPPQKYLRSKLLEEPILLSLKLPDERVKSGMVSSVSN